MRLQQIIYLIKVTSDDFVIVTAVMKLINKLRSLANTFKTSVRSLQFLCLTDSFTVGFEENPLARGGVDK